MNCMTSLISQSRAVQMRSKTSIATGLFLPSLATDAELKEAFSFKSFFFIPLSIKSFQSLLYEIRICITPTKQFNCIKNVFALPTFYNTVLNICFAFLNFYEFVFNPVDMFPQKQVCIRVACTRHWGCGYVSPY